MNSHSSVEGRAPRHLVQFYENARVLTNAVVEFLVDGFAAKQPAIIIATPEHTHAFLEELEQQHVNTERLIATGQLVCLDAQEALSTFMVDEEPDEVLFNTHIGVRIEALAAEH